MGKLCSCEFNSDLFSTETNLGKIEKYSNLKDTKNIDLNYDNLITKCGTRWENISGLEKIILTHKINFIIKAYREHLKRIREKQTI